MCVCVFFLDFELVSALILLANQRRLGFLQQCRIVYKGKGYYFLPVEIFENEYF